MLCLLLSGTDHTEISRLLMAGIIPALVGDALGESAFLYKEKLNWKYPGGEWTAALACPHEETGCQLEPTQPARRLGYAGAGYAAHQDAPAYKEISNHCTCLLSVDDSTMANGCLEFAGGRHQEGMIGLTADGIVSSVEEAKMEFDACETEKGDVVIFSSYVPHRSLPNTSENSRNLLYLTYNAQSEGYKRDEYYRNKRANMDSGSVRFSSRLDSMV